MTKITIMGSGNGGMTAAYHLSRSGHDVCLFDLPEFSAQVVAVRKAGGITALGENHGCTMLLEGFATVSLATTDIREAAAFADIILMVCPSFAQEPFFEKILPYLRNGHVLVLMPGNYGGLVLHHKLKQSSRKNVHVTFADAITLPWACRAVAPGVVSIMGIKQFLPLSLYPAGHAEASLKDALSGIFPLPLEFLPNPLVAGLENINFGGHPLLTVLNMGLLENFQGNFNYYKDCCSTATANAAAQMDRERLAVGESLGFTLRTELDAMNQLYGSKFASVYEFNRASTPHMKISGAPTDSKNRYVSEDVPYLLVPCHELAAACGVKTPMVTSCIHIASAYNQEDYFSTGRTLGKMGFAGLGKKEILQRLSL